MKKSTATAVAAAVVLSMAGGVSATFLTLGALGDASADPQPIVSTEYVDVYGNPVFAPGTWTANGEEAFHYEDHDDYEEDEEYEDHDDYEEDEEYEDHDESGYEAEEDDHEDEHDEEEARDD